MKDQQALLKGETNGIKAVIADGSQELKKS